MEGCGVVGSPWLEILVMSFFFGCMFLGPGLVTALCIGLTFPPFIHLQGTDYHTTFNLFVFWPNYCSHNHQPR